MSEIARYAIDLRSMTGGQGTFRSTFSHYEPVPPHLAEKIIAEAKQAKEAKTSSLTGLQVRQPHAG